MLITSRNVAFFLIFGMVSGLPIEVFFSRIFLQLYLIELLVLLGGLELLNQYHLICKRHHWFVSKTSELWNFRSSIWPYFVILNNKWLQVVLYVKSLQEYQVNASVPLGSSPMLFLLYISTLYMMLSLILIHMLTILLFMNVIRLSPWQIKFSVMYVYIYTCVLHHLFNLRGC